jgi:dTMP kinase
VKRAGPARGLFITLEGIEGVGKSTQLARVAEVLRAHGREVVPTREPGGTEIGEQLRGVLLDNRHHGMHADTELLMMFAARAEHIASLIRPALARGSDVVCDRFTDATYAYQGGGRGLDRGRIAVLETFVQGTLRPDLTLLLDMAVEPALARSSKRGAADRFENETVAFFERVRGVYLDRAKADPARFRIIDAAGPLEMVAGAIESAIADVLS